MAALTVAGLAVLVVIWCLWQGEVGRAGILMIAIFAGSLPIADMLRNVLLTVVGAIVSVLNTMGAV